MIRHREVKVVTSNTPRNDALEIRVILYDWTVSKKGSIKDKTVYALMMDQAPGVGFHWKEIPELGIVPVVFQISKAPWTSSRFNDQIIYSREEEIEDDD